MNVSSLKSPPPAPIQTFEIQKLPKDSIKEEQAELVESIVSAVLQDYSPPLLDNAVNTLKEAPVQHSFKQWFLELLTPALISESNELSSVYKRLFLSSVSGVELFLNHFNQALETFSEGHPRLDPLNPVAEILEKKIVLEMNRLAQKENLQPVIPVNFSEALMREALNAKIMRLLLDCFPNTFKNKQKKHTFLTHLVSALIRKTADQLFTPEMIMILLDKLLYDEFTLKPAADSAPVEEEIFQIDEKFNKRFEILSSKLAQHAIKIGSSGEDFLTKRIYRTLIDILMFFYKQKLSCFMQRTINQSSRSNPVLSPLVFIEQLFYTSKEGLRLATMNIFLKKNNPEMRAIEQRIEKIFKSNLLFEKINNKIKRVEEISSSPTWTRLVKDSPRLEKLCRNLENTLFFFLHRPLLLKTLLSYLLESVRNEFISDHEEAC